MSGGRPSKRPRTNNGGSTSGTNSRSSRNTNNNINLSNLIRGTVFNNNNRGNNSNNGENANKRAHRQRVKAHLTSITNFQKLLPHQRKYIQTVSKIADDKAQRGMLVHHSTGSGKTASILGTMLQYMKTGRRIFLVTTLANMKSNSLEVYADLLLKYYKEALPIFFPGINANIVNMLLETSHASAKAEVMKALKSSKHDLHIEFMTFETLGSSLKLVERYGDQSGYTKKSRDFMHHIQKDGAVFLFDEAHELLQPSGTRPRELEVIAKLREKTLDAFVNQTTNSGAPLAHVYLFTATPGDTIEEYEEMLRFVRPAGQPPNFINLSGPDMKSALRKAIKYNMIDKADISKLQEYTGKIHDIEVACNVHTLHQTIICSVLGKTLESREKKSTVQKSQRQIAMLNHEQSRAGFMKRFKQMQNYLTETDIKDAFLITDKKDLACIGRLLTSGNVGFKKVHLPGDSTPVFVNLTKFGKIIDKIQQTPGKQLVYSEDKKTLKIIEELLKNRNGFKNKLFMAYDIRSVEKIQRLMNQPGNEHGEKIRVLGVTKSLFQGLDIKHLRGLHIIDQMSLEKHHRQMRGRIGRAFSLHHLPEKNRYASRYEYMCKFDKTETFYKKSVAQLVGGKCVSYGTKQFEKLAALSRYILSGFRLIGGGLNHVVGANGHTMHLEDLGINGHIKRVRYTNNARKMNAMTHHLNQEIAR